DEDHFWISAGSVCEHIRSLRDAGGRGILVAVEGGKRLTRQCQDRGLMAQLHDKAVCLDHFVPIARAQSDQSRYCPQRDEGVHRLVCRTILSIADGVMREYKDRGQFHEGSETHCRSGVVAKDKERRSKSAYL